MTAEHHVIKIKGGPTTYGLDIDIDDKRLKGVTEINIRGSVKTFVQVDITMFALVDVDVEGEVHFKTMADLG